MTTTAPALSAPGRSRFLVFLGLAAAVAAIAVGAQSRAQADDPEPFQIVEAPALTWGFKTSWRHYAPLPQTSDGAVAGGAGIYDISWPFEAGTYDPATATTRISYGGTVHWQKYRASELGWAKPPGYEGPEVDPYMLDVTLSDPEIAIDRDGSALTVVASSRNKSTWEMVEYGRVPIVDLDVLGVVPTVAAGATEWQGIVATVADAGRAVFDNAYLAGQVVDEVSFSYTGPGGAPDFSEHWDEPGSVALELVQNELFIDGQEAVDLEAPGWVDRENLIVHSMVPLTIGGVPYRRIEAFDLEQMEPLGEPLTLPYAESPQILNIVAHDSSSDRLLYRAVGETGIKRWLEFDPETGYETGVFSDPQLGETSFIGTASQRLAWDPTREQAYRVQRISGEWKLITYEEGTGGTWIKQLYAMPGFGAAETTGYASTYRYDVPTYATASDGSLIVLATTRTSSDPSNPSPPTIPGAYRLVLDEGAGTVAVAPLPDLEVTNNGAGIFKAVQTSANGHVLLIAASGNTVHCQIEAGGEVACDNPVSIDANVEPAPYDEWRFAIDPSDGMVWYGGIASKKLAGIKDGGFLGGQLFGERNPRGGPVLVGDDHTVYAQTNDGSPGVVGGTQSWGYGKFERLGLVPAVAAQPQPESVSLGVGEPSAEAVFSSAAGGDPVPSRQWQVKTPGSSTFSDLAGEDGETLTVDATRALDGAEYRAVYENAAGSVASEAAALEVEYAPLLLADAEDVSAVEGEPAELSVLADGDPAPEISWQRRVGGFWQGIADDDDNFVIGGSSLTVIETNVEQSGALFRARLRNSLGTVFSRPAKLTVRPRTTIPAGGIDLDRVRLEWTGSAELQKAPPFGGSSYFSAGVSDGKEATYRSVAGNAAVFQVSSSGGEAVATWPTRAAHVQGGGEQLVRLYGGEGRVEEDGSASIAWDGSFSVNFYGGLAPFTLSDPELVVGADGTGELSADLSGCASSQANPNQCDPFAPVADVTVATFSGVEIDPAQELVIEPDYAGVEVTVPSPFAPQERTGSGWGAWPQAFVDFHLQTGLSSYWYSSSGAADPYKAPTPLRVELDGELPPADPGPAASGGSGAQPTPAPQPQVSPGPVVGSASISRLGRVQTVGRGRAVTVAQLSCAGASPCRVTVPRAVRLRIAGRAFRAKVLAPRTVAPGSSSTVRLKLSKAALKRLRRGAGKARVKIVVRSGGAKEERTVRVRIAKRKRSKRRPGGAGGDGGPGSAPVAGPLSPEPPLLARPATAVDVTGIEVAWHPRDSWVRYASSGVGPGDGILFADGAAGLAAAASPCPDRPSSSDAQLPYTVTFAPRASWYDPVSGSAGIYGQGSVAFRWAAHSIDLVAADPEIEIAGTASRAIFRFNGSGGTAYPNQRAALVGLDLSGQPTVTNGGKTFSYGLMRGRLTGDGVNVFAGFYGPPSNDEFGCVSVEFTTP